MSAIHARRRHFVPDRGRIMRRIAGKTVGDAGMRTIEAADGGLEAPLSCRDSKPADLLPCRNGPAMNSFNRSQGIWDSSDVSSVTLRATGNDPASDATTGTGAGERVARSLGVDIPLGGLDQATFCAEDRR